MNEPIETPRLYLRPLEASDWPLVLAYMSDVEVLRYLPWQPFTEEEVRAFIAGPQDGDEADHGFPDRLAVVRKATGALVGHVSLEMFSPKYRTREMGYILHRDHQGKGYATEASRALMSYGFRMLNLHRVIATCDPRNSASFGVMEKLGMRREAHFRKDVQIRGEWSDEYFYAILKEEWEARQRVIV